MTSQNNTHSFIHRLYVYQKERFPFLINGIVLSIFAYSAIAYSRLFQGLVTFIDWKHFAAAAFTTITTFFLLRIIDEFKDEHNDAKHRPYLPVPRGLITLKELAILGGITVFLQVVIILLIHPAMFLFYVAILFFLLLLRYEFFLGSLLKGSVISYMLSHMLIVPVVDTYASGVDWFLKGSGFHWGIILFFVVSYCNGLVFEIGRKVRVAEKEEVGFDTYTKVLGEKGGVLLWMASLLATLGFALYACYEANLPNISRWGLIFLFLICVIPGILFYKSATTKLSKWIEVFSGIWMAFMYLLLGLIPMLLLK